MNHQCDWCGAREERVFKDSWSCMRLCLICLGIVAPYVTNSPQSEDDNLTRALHDYVGPQEVIR